MLTVHKNNLLLSILLTLAVLISILLAGFKLLIKSSTSNPSSTTTPHTVNNTKGNSIKPLTIHKLDIYDKDETIKLIGYDGELLVAWNSISNKIRTLRSEPNVISYALSPSETFLAYTKLVDNTYQIYVDNLKDQNPPKIIHQLSNQTNENMEIRYTKTFEISSLKFVTDNELYIFADKLYLLDITPAGSITEINQYPQKDIEDYCADTFDGNIKSDKYLSVQYGCFEGIRYSLFNLQSKTFVNLDDIGIILGGHDIRAVPIALIGNVLYVSEGIGGPTDMIHKFNIETGNKISETNLPNYILSTTVNPNLHDQNAVTVSAVKNKFAYAYLGTVYSTIGFGPIIYDLTNQDFLSSETMNDSEQYIIQTEDGIFYIKTNSDFYGTLIERENESKIFDELKSFYFY